MVKTPIEILQAAKAVIDHPLKWTVGSYARDGADREVPINSPDACKFCLIGALYKGFGYSYAPDIHDKLDFRIAWNALSDVTECEGQKLAPWNDALGRDHSEVIEAIDAAIERLRQ